MEKAHPGLQPALVFLSYPFALIAIISIACMYFLFTHRDGRKGEVATPATHSPSNESPNIQSP